MSTSLALDKYESQSTFFDMATGMEVMRSRSRASTFCKGLLVLLSIRAAQFLLTIACAGVSRYSRGDEEHGP